MSCCVGYGASLALIEETVQAFYPLDYKVFVAQRTARGGIDFTLTVGVSVPPDVHKNTQLFEALLALGTRTDVCIRLLSSQIDMRETTVIDLFLLEITTEMTL